MDIKKCIIKIKAETEQLDDVSTELAHITTE